MPSDGSIELGATERRLRYFATPNFKSHTSRVFCESESEDMVMWGNNAIVATTEWMLEVEEKPMKSPVKVTQKETAQL